MKAPALLLTIATLQVTASTLFSRCSKDNDCEWNQKCRFSSCVCRPGFAPQNPPVACAEAPKLGENCSATILCTTPYAFCFYNDTCICAFPYEPVGDRCVLPAKTLGQQCRSREECVVAYSQCLNGVCRCKPGFQTEQNACTPYGYNCNTGPTPLVDGKIIRCKFNFTSLADDCPEGLFCVTLSKLVDSSESLDGFCCNRTYIEYSYNSAQCPVGFSEQMGNCMEPSASSFTFFDPVSEETLCCPMACPAKSRLHENRCYNSILEVGDVCSFSAECPIGTVCVANRCICQPGYVAVDGDCYPPACSVGLPLRNFHNGELVECSWHSPCPSPFHCIHEFGICCSDLDLIT
uniref:EGF-like domain-containing protein n=1 Tax=Trichuris muris TaxID=70415 RepID=A0A5S6QHT3_TRIMR